MNNEPFEEKSPLGDEIFQAIKSGKVVMRPRWYFILRDTIGVVAIVIVLLMAVYLASFIIFVLHGDGAWFVPVFGFAGWYALFNDLPWVLILLSAIFVVALAFLVKRYQFAYRWPLLYSFLGVIFLIAAACFIFVQTSFYNEFFNSTIPEGVPLLGMYYPGFGTLGPNDIHRGVIVSVASRGFTLQDNASNISNIVTATGTQEPFGGAFQVGEVVVVFGNRSATGTIFAAGVEKVL